MTIAKQVCLRVSIADAFIFLMSESLCDSLQLLAYTRAEIINLSPCFWPVLHPPSTPPPYSQQRRVGDPNVFTNHAGDTSGFGQWAVNPSNGQWAARPTSSTPIHSHQVNALSFSAGLYLCARLCLCSTFKPRVPAYCLYCISSVSTLLCASACILLLSTCALLLSICLSHTHLPRG